MSKTCVLIAALSLTGLIVAGCSTSQKTSAVSTYQCPQCKDTVQWTMPFGPSKGWIKQKEVVHTCTMCKKEWVANVSTTNTCPECNQQALVCPVCRAKGS